jgi:aminoglycoside/choline kinase family phosphotransferase
VLPGNARAICDVIGFQAPANGVFDTSRMTPSNAASTNVTPEPDPRAGMARQWAQAALGLDQAAFVPASADASFRRYFRISHGGNSWIVMDAPPEREDCRPFVRVAAMLAQAGVHVPRVHAQDLARGLLLLSDLGTQTFLDVLRPDNADALFEAAIGALLRWQLASRPQLLPPYDAALLRRELALFPDWYLKAHLGVSLAPAEAGLLEQVCAALVDDALAQPQGYVHRDFMPRNLMLSSPNPGVLDFQDAVYGPLAYDAVSLFRDAFLSWPAADVQRWLQAYHRRAVGAGVPLADWQTFRRHCDWIGLQRHLKVLGIFARLTLRDGKPRYLADTPRFVRYVMEVAAQYPELAPLAQLFRRHVLPRVAPAA